MSTQTKITPATKYRVAVRAIGVQHGWTFTQVSPSIDKFEKNGVVVAVDHGPSNLIRTAEIMDAKKKIHDVAPRAGKMFTVQEWLTGVADPDHQRYIRLSPEEAQKYESGQGIAKLTGVFTATPADEPVLAPKPTAPAKKATTKVSTRAAKKTLSADEIAAAKKAAAGPAKRPTPRAAAKAPAAKA